MVTADVRSVAARREIARPCRKCHGRGHEQVLNGPFFKAARERAGVTQEEMARVCEVSPGYLSRMENGGDLPFLPRYAEIYDAMLERRRRSGGAA